MTKDERVKALLLQAATIQSEAESLMRCAPDLTIREVRGVVPVV